MLKNKFFALTCPRIDYDVLPVVLPKPEKISPTKYITLFHDKNGNQSSATGSQVGDKVKTGQKLALYKNDPAYVIASASGTISSISPYSGDFGKNYAAITIEIDSDEVFDDQFKTQAAEPNLATALENLSFIPGSPPLNALSDTEREIKTIVICGVDSDLLLGTQQYIVKSRFEEVSRGIEILKKISGIEQIYLITAGETVQTYGHIGARVKSIDTRYPSALPQLIMKNILGEVVPAGKSCEDLGVCFFSSEAVASIGSAYASDQVPVTKSLTLITKDGNQRIIETKIGTPIKDILETYGVSINEEDRIIFGGPMTGSAVYSLEHPIQPDTDGLVVLDRSNAAYTSEYPCINCGDCVRACPANIQINLLVRFLEAGQYEAAAESYDLLSCIDCGLCSFVCVSKIPIYQYIKLAKYELDRAKAAEETNA
ncbi:MAG: 4Fe-4S dicluster domain-containing protein [Desulfobacterales bacterium]|jgi:electron transport complex protein RnfC